MNVGFAPGFFFLAGKIFLRILCFYLVKSGIESLDDFFISNLFPGDLKRC